MNRLLRTGLPALLAFASALAFAQEETKPSIDAKAKEAVLNDMHKVLTTTAFVPGVDFNKWNEVIAEFKPDLDKAESPEQFAVVVNTALQKFGFSHILLFSPVAAERRVTNRMVGIGVRIEIEEKGIRVIRVYEDGAAHGAGVKPGDLIIEADGKPVKSPSDLAGEEGQPVKVKIDRNGVIIEREMVRKTFSMIVPEELAFPEKEVAMFTLPSFDATYNTERVQELMAKADASKNLILDLRGNGGGRVINLLHFASFFLDREQALGTFVDRAAMENYTEETGDKAPSVFKIAEWNTSKVRPLRRNKEPYKGEIVVLIDGGSGSASEMMAAALKEHRGAKIVGSQSAGAVLASTMRVLSNGFLLQYPLMDYVTIKGMRLEGNGLVPDVVTPTPRFGQDDAGVKEALRLLKKTA